MEILAVVSIIGWVFLIQRWNSNLKGLAPYYVVSILIPILFLAAYLSILKPATTILMAGGTVGFIFFVYVFFQQIAFKKIALRIFNFNLLAVLIFFSLSIFWYLRSKHYFVSGFDEFFWALFTKSIYFESKLYDASSPVLLSHYRYPPGIPLWQYYFTAFGSFKENSLYLANGLATMAALTALLQFKSKISFLANIVVVFLFVFILAGLSSGFANLYVDNFIGFCLGMSFISLLKIETEKDIFWFLPQLWLFCLFKQTGSIVSGFLAVGLAIQSFKVFQLDSHLKKIEMATLILIQPLIPYFIWRHHLGKISEIATPFDPEKVLGPDSLVQISSNLELSKSIIAKFVNALKDMNIFYSLGNPQLNISFLYIVTLFSFFLGYYYFSFRKLKSHQIKVVLLTSFLTCAAWLSVHLLSYLLIHPEREGSQLAALTRYLITFVIGLGLLSIYCFGEIISEQPHKRFKANVFCFFVVALVFLAPTVVQLNLSSITTQIENTQTAKNTAAARQSLAVTSEIITQTIPTFSNVWVIFQNSNGEDSMITRLLISPRRMLSYPWSLGLKYGENDQWTKNMSVELIRDTVMKNKTDYFFVARADKMFWMRYSELFHPTSKFENNTAFKVQTAPDEKYLFHPVK